MFSSFINVLLSSCSSGLCVPAVQCPTMFWVVDMVVTSGPGDDKWDAIIALHSHLICSISPFIIINITNQNRNDSCNMQCFVLILLANDILPFNIYNFPYIGCFIFDIIIFHSQVINLKLKVSVCLLYHYRILGSALQLLYKEFLTKIFF